MRKYVLTIATALLLCTSGAMAQQRAAVKACAADIKTQCTGVQPGEGRIKACVQEHFADLSEPCQAVLLKAVALKACAADIKQSCAGMKAGGGQIAACMKEHFADLSQPCKDVLTQAATGKK